MATAIQFRPTHQHVPRLPETWSPHQVLVAAAPAVNHRKAIPWMRCLVPRCSPAPAPGIGSALALPAKVAPTAIAVRAVHAMPAEAAVRVASRGDRSLMCRAAVSAPIFPPVGRVPRPPAARLGRAVTRRTPVAVAAAARLASPARRDAAQAPVGRGWGPAAWCGRAGPSRATTSAPALRQELVGGALVLRAASPRA